MASPPDPHRAAALPGAGPAGASPDHDLASAAPSDLPLGRDGAAAADPPERVRVVLADAALARQVGHARAELAEQSQVGEALVRGLMRTQLGLALRLAAVVAIGLGGLPLLFAVAPAVAEARPFGVALPWLLLGFVAYPFLFGVGAAYVWLSERTEADFTELVDRPVSRE